MQLIYELVERRFDETTQMQTTTEQARLPDGSWLIRTVMYTPYLITADVSHIKASEKLKKIKKKRGKKKNRNKRASLFDPIG